MFLASHSQCTVGEEKRLSGHFNEIQRVRDKGTKRSVVKGLVETRGFRMSCDDVDAGNLSEMSSDDEFFDPEEDVPMELPGPSWLTRTLKENPTGDATETTGSDAHASPAALASHGSLEISHLVATMPSTQGEGDEPGDGDMGEHGEAKNPDQDSTQNASSPRAASPSPGTHKNPSTLSTPPGTVDGSNDSSKEAEIPSTAFRLKDLDTGREYIVDEAAADVMIGGRRGSSGQTDTGNTPTVVRDLQSGRDVPVKELEESLGLSPLMREMSLREQRQRGDEGGDEASGRPSGSKPDADASTSEKDFKKDKKPFGRNPGRWMTKRFAEASRYAEELKKTHLQSSDPSAPMSPSSPSDPMGNQSDNDTAGEAINDDDPLHTHPTHPTVKVQVNRKMYKEFTEMRRAQTLRAHDEAVWTMKFNHDGRYLATAGQDRVVRVWELDLIDGSGVGQSSDPSSPTDSEANNNDADKNTSKTSYKIRGDEIFKSEPRREYRGHRGDILDLCWSHTDWLLSSSMDKTVRLWYVTMDECLRIFSHQDFVTAIDFHPLNDKYFLSGSLDGKLRFWSIPDHRVADWVDIGEMVTAASFNSDGSVAAAGSYKGKCHFYAMDGVRFEYLTHLEVKHSRGSHKKSGKKITGLSFMPGDDRKLLVTSNDSRIRVYDGYTLACKYKGHKNNNSQIRASFSPGAEFIVCGSEDENVYVWSTVNSFVPSINPIYTGYRRDKHSSYEQFAAQCDITTVALFAPRGVREARQGEAAAAIAKAQEAAKSDIQTSAAAAALFRGGPQSPFSGEERSPTAKGNHGQPGENGKHATEVPSGAVGFDAAEKTPIDVQREEARDDAAKAKAEGERAFAAGMAIGQIVITAGYSGEIRIFENVGSPQWL